MLAEVGLLEPVSSELHRGAADPLWRSLAELDAYRRRFESIPDTLTNAILLGTVLIPLGISVAPPRYKDQEGNAAASGPKLGALPLARRDVERLRQILGLQRRLRDVTASPRAQRALAQRSLFREALTWLEIHGDAPDVVASWNALLAELPVVEESGPAEVPGAPGPGTGRRRRRRRRRRRPIRPVGS
jgi:hypothetical protein